MWSSVLALVHVLVVLGIVIALIYLLARVGQKHFGMGSHPGRKTSGRIEILSRYSVGKNSSLMVIRVAPRVFLVGQSAEKIELLSELDGESWIEEPMGASESSLIRRSLLLTPRTASGIGGEPSWAWDALIDRLREMTVRR